MYKIRIRTHCPKILQYLLLIRLYLLRATFSCSAQLVVLSAAAAAVVPSNLYRVCARTIEAWAIHSAATGEPTCSSSMLSMRVYMSIQGREGSEGPTLVMGRMLTLFASTKGDNLVRII